MSPTENRTPPELAAIVIKRLGGTGSTATFCGVSAASVSLWKTAGISGLRTEWIKTRRPDVFHDLKGALEAERLKAAEQTAAA